MRKHYLDNVRYSIVLLVIFYHVIYILNSVGVIRNVTIQGIGQMDVFLYIIYPWFMVCLFAVAGMSARYALEKQGDGQFLKARLKRILLPSVAGIFLLGWVCGWVTDQYVDMFGEMGAELPGAVRYLIYCISGIGPLWFAHELMLASLVLVLIRKADRQDKLGTLGGRTGTGVLFLLVFAVWGSAQILNTPLMEIYRNGIYIFMFLVGYYVFSHERVQELLKKWAVVFLGIAAVAGIVYTAYYWGKNYSEMRYLKSFLTNFYAWFGTLAVLGCGKRYWDRETKFTRYMRRNGFAFYVLHYPLLAVLAYVFDRLLNPPAFAMYLLLLLGEIIGLPVLTALIKKIPVVRTLLLGE